VVPAAVVPQGAAPVAAAAPQDARAVPPGVVPVAAAARDVVPHHGAVRAKAAQAAAAALAVQREAVPVATVPAPAGVRADLQAAEPAAATLASPTPSAE
jgi:hypothetical protein